MVHKELEDLLDDSWSNKVKMYLEVAFVYMKCMLFFPNVPELRQKLITMMRGFFINLKNEAAIIQILDKALISQEEFDDILVYLDELFSEAWFYYDEVLGDFETAMTLKNLHRVLYRRDEVKALNDEKKEEILSLIWRYEQKAIADGKVAPN